MRGLLSIPIQGFNRLVQSCPIVFITHVVYVMAHAYRCCLLISKQCTRGLVYSRNSSDLLGRVYFLVFCFTQRTLITFSDNIKFFSHSTKFFLTQLHFILIRLKIFSHSTKIFLTNYNFFSTFNFSLAL